MNNSYVFAIDISGVPPKDDTTIALVRFEYNESSKIIEKFKQKFFNILKKKEKKG